MIRSLSFLAVVFTALCAFTPCASAQDDPFKNMTPEEKKKHDEETKAMLAAATSMSLCAIVSIAFVVILGLIAWSIPIVIAMYRGHPDTAGISLVTLLLGWTGIGWILALVWSVKSFPRTSRGDARDY